MTRVLIVDDDATLRTSIGRDLGANGFAVFLAEDADRASAVLAEQAIDVMLTDLRMPCADGIDLLDRARELSPRTRSILMSGFATARDYQRAIEYGAVRVLCKPFTSRELLQSIQLAVECETGFRGSVHGLSLIDLLQMFHFGRRSLTVAVEGTEGALVCLEQGRIIHARHGSLEGEPALHALLAMRAGSVHTTVLAADTPNTIVRDFEPLLLDVLRRLDEGGRGPPPTEIAFDFDPAFKEAAGTPDLDAFAHRLRAIDGYTAAFLVDVQGGAVLGSDGDTQGLDLAIAATGYAELYQAERSAIAAMAIDDRMQSVVITLGRQYHILYSVHSDPSLLVCAVVERRPTNIGLIRHALTNLEGRDLRGAGELGK